MGASPQTPGVYRIEDQSMREGKIQEIKKDEAAQYHAALILRSPSRRSGCSPALPYPPEG